MSRYQTFQEWWSRATSGPSDFRIDKRSAEIGFKAALDVMEKNLTAHNRQITPCPCCSEPWDMSRNNACQCGAVLKQPGTA